MPGLFLAWVLRFSLQGWKLNFLRRSLKWPPQVHDGSERTMPSKTKVRWLALFPPACPVDYKGAFQRVYTFPSSVPFGPNACYERILFNDPQDIKGLINPTRWLQSTSHSHILYYGLPIVTSANYGKIKSVQSSPLLLLPSHNTRSGRNVTNAGSQRLECFQYDSGNSELHCADLASP